MTKRTIGKIAALGLVAASVLGGTAAFADPDPYRGFQARAQATIDPDDDEYSFVTIKVFKAPPGCKVKADVNNRDVKIDVDSTTGFGMLTIRVKAGNGAHLVHVKTVDCDDDANKKETKASFTVGGADNEAGSLTPPSSTVPAGNGIPFTASGFPSNVNLSVIIYDANGKAIRNRTLKTGSGGTKSFSQGFSNRGTFMVQITGGGTYAFASVSVT